MSKGSRKLIYDESLLFAEKLSKIKRKDSVTFKRVKKTIEKLLINPAGYDRALQGFHRCKFEKYVGRELARIVYTWCENCRKYDCAKVNECDDCEKKADNTLRLFDVLTLRF